MQRLFVVLSAILVFLVAGCTSGGGHLASSDSAPIRTARSTTTTGRAGRVATAADLEEAYNATIPEVKDALAKLPACASLTAPTCDAPHRIAWLQMSLAVKMFEVEVTGISDTRSGNKFYRGAIPDKYANVVSDALFDAGTLVSSLDQLSPACVGADAPSTCQSTMDQTVENAERFVADLKRWP